MYDGVLHGDVLRGRNDHALVLHIIDFGVLYGAVE